MNAPSFISGTFAPKILAPPVQTNRRRHTWRWRLIFLLLGLCLGWIARGIFN